VALAVWANVLAVWTAHAVKIMRFFCAPARTLPERRDFECWMPRGAEGRLQSLIRKSGMETGHPAGHGGGKWSLYERPMCGADSRSEGFLLC